MQGFITEDETLPPFNFTQQLIQITSDVHQF